MAVGRACVGRGSRNKVEGIFVPFLWLQGKEDSSRMTQGQGRGKEKLFQGRRSFGVFMGGEEKLREDLESERKQKSMVKSFEEEEKDSKIRYRGKKEEKV